MKTQYTGLPLLLVVIFFAFTAFTARSAQEGDFTYQDNGAGITITGYTGSGGAVTIPDTIAGKPVTIIGYSAFAGRHSLTSVTIPNSVTSIGGSAFSGCTGLTSVTIPKSVTNIGLGPFTGCPNLRSITVDSLNPAYISSDGVLFDKAQTILIQCPGKTGSYAIPASVTAIGDGAFYGSGGLVGISVPNTVTSIGKWAFFGCSGLTSVVIPDSVITIGEYAFFNCTGLNAAPIGNRVTSIGEGAFRGTGLTSVVIPKSVTTIGSVALSPCTALANIRVDPLNPAYSSVDGVLFNKDKTVLIQYPGGKVGGYIIPNTVTSLDYFAFQDCVGLTSIIIPDSATPIFRNAFYGCTSLTDVSFRNGLTRAGYRMKLSPVATSPNFVPWSTFFTVPWSISVSANHAFVLADQSIAIFDASDPANPRAVSSIGPGVQRFTVDGNSLYELSNSYLDSDFSIWDTTDQARPAKKGTLSLGPKFRSQNLGYSRPIRAAGPLVFVSQSERGGAVAIIDVSDLNQPKVAGVYQSPGGIIGGLAVAEDRLFVTSDDALETVDISNPASPKLLDSRSLDAGLVSDIEVAAGTAFVAASEGVNQSLLILDVSQNDRPVELARIPGGAPIKVVSGKLYANGTIFDLSDRSNPAPLGTFGMWPVIDVSGGKIYAAFQGVEIIDVNNPQSPTTLGNWTPPDQNQSYGAIILAGNYAYIQRYDLGSPSLLAFDITDPTAPQLISTFPWPGGVIEATGNRLYQWSPDNVVRVIDVSDPRSPTSLAEVDLNIGAATVMAAAGNLLFVVTQDWNAGANSTDNRLHIMDLTIPSAPAPGGQLDLGSGEGSARIRVAERHALITLGSKMHIIDVENLSAPRIVGTYSTSEGETLESLATSGNYAFVQSLQHEMPWSSSIHVVDVTDPAHPTAVAVRRHLFSYPESMHVAGRRLYLYHHESWMPGEYDLLTVMDITNPREMFQVGQFDDYQFWAMAANEQSVVLVGRSLQVFRPEFLPELGLQTKGGQIELNWPNVDTAFRLQERADLNPASPWINILGLPTVKDGQNYLTVPADANLNFFRLEKR